MVMNINIMVAWAIVDFPFLSFPFLSCVVFYVLQVLVAQRTGFLSFNVVCTVLLFIGDGLRVLRCIHLVSCRESIGPFVGHRYLIQAVKACSLLFKCNWFTTK